MNTEGLTPEGRRRFQAGAAIFLAGLRNDDLGVGALLDAAHERGDLTETVLGALHIAFDGLELSCLACGAIDLTKRQLYGEAVADEMRDLAAQEGNEG